MEGGVLLLFSIWNKGYLVLGEGVPGVRFLFLGGLEIPIDKSEAGTCISSGV